MSLQDVQPSLHGAGEAPAGVPAAAKKRRIVNLVPLSEARIVAREFNRGFLDRSDPLEGQGAMLPAFNFAASYPVEREKQSDLIHKLHANVYAHVRDGSIPAAVQVADFRDVRTAGREEARRYLVVEAETTRSTRLSVYTTFLTYGDNLYVAIDSFILPPVSVWKAAAAGTVAALFLLASLQAGIFGFLLVSGIVVWYFRDLARSLSQGDPPEMAIRKKFPKSPKYSTFNTDDVLMFFKSTIPLVLRSVQEVFEEADIPVDVLERAIQNVNFVNTINTGGGVFNAVNSVLGGMGNQVGSAAPRP